MASKRQGQGQAQAQAQGQSQSQGQKGIFGLGTQEATRSSKTDRPTRPRITKLGSFQDDSDEIVMQATSRTTRNSSLDNSEQGTKRRSSTDRTKASGRLPETAELRSTYRSLTSPSSLQRGAAAMEQAYPQFGSPRQQEERPSVQSNSSSKGKSSQGQKSSSTARRSSRAQSSAADDAAGYQPFVSSSSKRSHDSSLNQPETENAAAAMNDAEERRRERAWPVQTSSSRSLPLPPRSFYAPGPQASNAIERLLKRTRVAGPNPLFPMFAGRPIIAAGRGTRVELHVHLEGAVRHATIWELMKKKKMTLPGDGSVRAIKEAIVLTEPVPPAMFFEPVPIYMQCIVGDLNALERIAYEFCEDKVREGVLYVEVRYSPRMLLGKKLPVPRARAIQDLAEVVMAINRGFRVGERVFGIVVRTILSLIAGKNGCSDVISLVQQFQDDGVVGIDLHMPYENTQKEPALPGLQTEEVPLSREVVKAFMQAAHLGISRTVHAGLLGSAYMVQRGIEKYRAQRIGHGYEVLKLPQLYVKSKERDVHFECCPWMSLLASSVDPTEPKHPIAQFAEDGMNFSLNTSHPTLTGLTLQEEYDLVSSWGFSEVHLVRSNINALRSSFLQPIEKSNLMQTLLENLGIKRRSLRK